MARRMAAGGRSQAQHLDTTQSWRCQQISACHRDAAARESATRVFRVSTRLFEAGGWWRSRGRSGRGLGCRQSSHKLPRPGRSRLRLQDPLAVPTVRLWNHMGRAHAPNTLSIMHVTVSKTAGRMRGGSRGSAAWTRQHEQEERCRALEVLQELEEMRQA